jgi:RNA polymerase sigma factor (sigma-70 family)
VTEAPVPYEYRSAKVLHVSGSNITMPNSLPLTSTVTPLTASDDLLQRAKSGDTQAIDQLLRQCQPDIKRYARRHCASADVDEAVQDALWILTRRISALRVAAALSSWLFQTVRRLCIRMHRRAIRRVSLEDVEHVLLIDERNATDLRIDLAKSITAMPEQQREILMLVDVLGHSAAEAAQTAGISLEAAKSRLHRARLLLRESLR